MTDYDLEPSSDDAIEQGCKCPRWSNRVTKIGPSVTAPDCPLHGDSE